MISIYHNTFIWDHRRVTRPQVCARQTQLRNADSHSLFLRMSIKMRQPRTTPHHSDLRQNTLSLPCSRSRYYHDRPIPQKVYRPKSATDRPIALHSLSESIATLFDLTRLLSASATSLALLFFDLALACARAFFAASPLRWPGMLTETSSLLGPSRCA